MSLQGAGVYERIKAQSRDTFRPSQASLPANTTKAVSLGERNQASVWIQQEKGEIQKEYR